jgi:hypothetical protein
MKTMYSFLTVFLLSCIASIGAYADFGEWTLTASNNSENPVATEHFTEPLTDSEVWIIEATTRYFGEASNATWGSRLFHAYRDENPWPNGESGNFTSESKLCFYMRPPVGAPGATTSNTGKLLLANNVNNTPDVLDIDAVNGTLFTFKIISDGTGEVQVEIYVEGNNDGNPYTKTYSNHEIGTVYGIAAGQNRDVEVTIRGEASDPVLSRPSDLDFRWILQNETATKPLVARGVNLVGGITAAITGADAAAFSLASATVASGDTLAIAFTPTAIKAYSATLTLSSDGAEPVEATLKGEGIAELPVTVSPEDGEATWYYVQFARRSADAKVWTAYNDGDTVKQAILQSGSDAQLWKISGSWDHYYLTNKSVAAANPSAADLSYDITKDKYVLATTTEEFAFSRFKDTQDWQLQNLLRTFVDTTKQAEVPGKNYVNDYQGKDICAYTFDDAGNQLVFIPSDASRLFAGPDSIGFAKFPVGYSSTKKQTVVTLNLPAFTFGLTGTGKNAFAVTQAADTLVINFTPSEERSYEALLTVTAGTQSHAIKLAGTGVKLPVKISSDDSEYWYQIQFNRQNTKAFQDNGEGEQISQVEKVESQDNQLWKITGAWDKYKIVGKSGREFKYDTSISRYIAVASGEGDPFRIESNTDGNWGLYNMTHSTYVNDYGGNGGSELSHWSFDAGSVINFLATFANITAASLSFPEIEQGASFTKELSVASTLLTTPITFALSGSDAAAFSVEVKLSEEEGAPVLAENTLYQEGGTLLVTFAPTEKREYRATLTLSATGAEDLDVTLSGTADFSLPVLISDDTVEKWYYISFKRQSSKVLSIGDEGLLQETKVEEANEVQQWKFTGTPATGYQLINKSFGAVAYSADIARYENGENGDRHQFIRATNGTDWQLYNLTTAKLQEEDAPVNYRYFNDYNGEGEYASLYAGNDAGNYLLFTPVDATAIRDVEPANDTLVATRYYTLQGIEVRTPSPGSIYIKQDLYASKRVKASKIYIPVR